MIWPPHLREYYLKFFWWPLTYAATGQLILNRKCYQVFKTEMELHMIDIIYAALPMCEQTEKRHSYAKTTNAKLYIYIGVGSRDLFIDEAHMTLGIFPVSFPCMLPTPLCGIFCVTLSTWISSFMVPQYPDSSSASTLAVLATFYDSDEKKYFSKKLVFPDISIFSCQYWLTILYLRL